MTRVTGLNPETRPSARNLQLNMLVPCVWGTSDRPERKKPSVLFCFVQCQRGWTSQRWSQHCLYITTQTGRRDCFWWDGQQFPYKLTCYNKLHLFYLELVENCWLTAVVLVDNFSLSGHTPRVRPLLDALAEYRCYAHVRRLHERLKCLASGSEPPLHSRLAGAEWPPSRPSPPAALESERQPENQKQWMCHFCVIRKPNATVKMIASNRFSEHFLHLPSPSVPPQIHTTGWNIRPNFTMSTWSLKTINKLCKDKSSHAG